jgi:Carboxypeptidase regulatory-like domain
VEFSKYSERKTRKSSGLRGRALASAAFSALSVAVVGSAALTMSTPAEAVEEYTSVNLQGRVVDGSGKPIVGAKVDATSDQGVTRSTTTSGNGSFIINSLPIGSYRIRISASGFQTYEDTANLKPGDSSFNFSLVAGADSSSSSTEKVTVVGKRVKTRVFDRTAQGAVFDTSDMESKLPVNRGTTGLALLAPGVTSGDTAFGFLPSTAGSAVNENTYYVNGFNVTSFRNYLGFSNIPFEFFQTLEVKTGGYQSEFGRATGGALITTTKSGSNEFHAGVIAYTSPDFGRETAPNTYLALNDYDYRSSSDITVYASGALIPDHLFVYGVYSDQYTVQEDVNTGNQVDRLVAKDPTYGVKVDGYINEDHHFEFTHFRDDDLTEIQTYNWAAGAATDFVGTTLVGSGGDANILRYTGRFAEWFTMSALYGHGTFDQFVGSAADNTCPFILDGRSGVLVPATGSCFVNSLPESGADEREAWRLDANFFFGFFGEHITRIGYDNETLGSANTLKYSGGQYFRYFNSGATPDNIATDAGTVVVPANTDYARVRNLQSGGSFETTNTSWYFQDAWKVMDGPVTVLAGLRLDLFDHLNALGTNFLKIEDQYAPRIGVSWDVFEDGTTKAYAFYGRYFLPIASNTNIRLAGSEVFTQSFFLCTTTPCILDANGLPTNGAGVSTLVGGHLYPNDPTAAPGLGTFTLSPGGVQDPLKIVTQGLKPMDEDEYLLGVERTFDDGWFDGWTLGLNLTYRKLGTTIEDAAVDEAIRDYCIANGIVPSGLPGDTQTCAQIWTGFHQFVLINPGSDVVVYTDELPGALTKGVMTQLTLPASLMNLPPASREYTAVEFKWTRPFDGTWGIDGSYTWSRGEGNYEGGVKSDIGQDDTSLTQDFDGRATMTGAYGLLPNHREHKLKVFGSYSPITDLVLGANMRVESPRQFGCVGSNPAGSLSPPGSQSASWYCPLGAGGAYILTPRGSQFEGDWLSQLDLTAIYNLPIGEGLDAALRVDVFNVLNGDASLDFDETGELGFGTPDPNYGKVTGYQTPRSVRFGVAIRY